MKSILIINGPNLNLLGKRQPHIYGGETFEDTLSELSLAYPDVTLSDYQSNHEGAIIDRIHQILDENLTGLIINGGAFTHYSYAIYDALTMIEIPKVEVHISHIFSREAFRQVSVISPACDGMITGFGRFGYRMAIEWLIGLK